MRIKKTQRSNEIEAMRNLIRDRGSYLYYLVTASKDSDPKWECIARTALKYYGCSRFKAAFSDVQDLQDFIARYLSDTTKQIFDSDLIECDANHAVIKAGYCPLLDAWLQCGADDNFAATLCDIAMDGDSAMVNSIPFLNFYYRKSLARGDQQCEFVVELKKEEK